MNILNKEELKRQIQEGKEISLDGILEEFITPPPNNLKNQQAYLTLGC